MRNDQYFKHDASASGNWRLMKLIQVEGMRGYGMYWLLLEVLRCQPDMCAPLSLLSEVARRGRTRVEYVLRIVENYDLFEVTDGQIRSRGLDRRMQGFVRSLQHHTPPIPEANAEQKSVKNECNSLIISSEVGDSAREEEKRREENNSSNGVAAAELSPIGPWQSLVDEMAADESWMEMAGLHSGLGQLFIDHRPEVVEIFKAHIRLYDKGGGLLRINDVRQYFANFLAAGSRTCQGVRQKLMERLRSAQKEALISPYETVVEGRRMYLGHPIPDDAPPRPDEFAVWDEEAHRWTR